MRLVVREFDVRDVTLGSRTSFSDGVLTVDADRISAALLASDAAINRVTFHIAKPGEATRVVCVKDVIQPHFKAEGAPPGAGTTWLLSNVAVVTCGPIVAFQEGIIDMSGVGADYTPFSQLSLVAVEIEVTAGTTPHRHEAAVRAAGLHVSKSLAETCGDSADGRSTEILWNESTVDSQLPRIAYVDMVLCQGLLHDTYVLGRNAHQDLPCTIDPRVIIDGGVVSGNCVSACDKSTTYHHQNNPLIKQLLAGHGTRWNFAGVVLTNLSTRLGEKQRSAQITVQLVRELGADGAVISKEGFGNPDADLMMVVRGLEAAGIKSVGITDEFAGLEGDSQSLADTTPEADAIISVGNANQRISLPPMQRVIGPLADVPRLAGGYPHSLKADGGMEVELQAIIGSTSQLGSGRLSCRGL